MRRLFWSTAIVATVWISWWFAATLILQRGFQAWLDTRQAEGWHVNLGTLTRAGFPFHLQLGLTEIAIASPATGVSFVVPDVTVSTPVYWPGDITVTLSDAPISISSQFNRANLSTQNFTAYLFFHPMSSLQFDQLGLTSGKWALETRDTNLMSGANLNVAIGQTSANPNLYLFEMASEKLALGETLRAALDLPYNWPTTFSQLDVSTTVGFGHPWDRNALSGDLPQPREISINRFEIEWGAMRLSASGLVAIDDHGRGTGTVTLKARNWMQMLDMAQNVGALPRATHRQITSMLRRFAELSGDADVLDITLTLRDGQMFLGFISLGPAPLFVLR